MKLERFIAIAAVCGGVAVLCGIAAANRIESPGVALIHTPGNGIQPQVVESEGVVHLIYFSGDPSKGDIYYVNSHDFGRTFSKAIRVNRISGSAVAIGNIRGAQLAIGRNGRVHVAWNGSSVTGAPAEGKTPMLYTRMNDAGSEFEPERNLVHSAWGLDGGGSIAADPKGNVYVFWHAPAPGQRGEGNRRVWMAKSTDDGKTFAPEVAASPAPTGTCGCCGMRANVDAAGNVYVLYRSATAVVNRDTWLLTSNNQGRSFEGKDISRWKIGACAMSAESLTPSPEGMLAAWETEKQVYFAHTDSISARSATNVVSDPVAAPGSPVNRKYPVVIENNRGQILFAWTAGTAWKRGGSVEWQVYDPAGHPDGAAGKADGVPAWSLVAAFPKPDGSFAIIY